MNMAGDLLQLCLFILLLFVSIPLLGHYMAKIYGHKTLSLPVLTWFENKIYKSINIDPDAEMTWKQYLNAVLIFNALGFTFLFTLLLTQYWLPFNPQSLNGLDPFLAFNTAVSFVTNTNWQAYAGETTLSYLSQMMGLGTQNFLSAATGGAVLIAFIRGITRKSSQTIGNYWVDLTRTLIYILLPMAFIFSLFLVSQGVIQNLNAYVSTEQTIPMGPAASQVAIKQLGTNGGGFFSANSAHPFENPTPASNFLQTYALLLIPAAATYMYGLLLNSRKQGLIILAVMLLFWFVGLTIALTSEYSHNSVLAVNPVLEGKESRFGIMDSVLWSTSTSSSSNGSVNAMLSSLSPLAGGVALFNMMIGEVVFGGIGVGLCSMLMFILLTVFLAGLMVGRTPAYCGKKIEKVEMQWVMLAILTPCALILLGASIAFLVPSALTSLSHHGPHGMTEMLYTFSSTAGNNGSSFAGLNANTDFYNCILGIVMLVARLAILTSSLAIGGSLAQKTVVAPSLGTFSTDTPLFGALLAAVIVVVAALTFFPALSLGPLIEQILMTRGQAF